MLVQSPFTGPSNKIMCSIGNVSILVISRLYSKSPLSESSVLFDFSKSSKVLAALHEASLC